MSTEVAVAIIGAAGVITVALVQIIGVRINTRQHGANAETLSQIHEQIGWLRLDANDLKTDVTAMKAEMRAAAAEVRAMTLEQEEHHEANVRRIDTLARRIEMLERR